MASRSPSPSKRGRREDDDDESRHRKKLEKAKEPEAKDADEEPLFNDNKFAREMLRIKAHHDVYKDPTVKGLAFRIHGLAEKLENLPMVKQAARRHSSSTTAALTTTMAATAATTVGLRLIDRLLYQLVTIMCVCFCVFVRFFDMNCLVCLSIMNCLVN
jgi:hypothetical protein